MALDPRVWFEVKVEGRIVAALYDGPDWYPNDMSTTMLSDVLTLLQVTTPTKLNYRFVGWKNINNQILDLQTATMDDVIFLGCGRISAEFVVDEGESSDPLDVSSYEGGNMLNSNIFRTRDVRWISANLDMREGKAFGHQAYLERGPSKFGFHVPSAEEREEVSDIVEELELTEYIHEALHLPKAGKMTGLDVVSEAGEEGYYLTRIPNANGTANVFHPSVEGSGILQMAIKNAISVRGFRNTPVVPTTEWTKFQAEVLARLPHEYQEVEYIQSSGTQFIDTGMAFTNDTKVDLDICFPVARTGWSGVMGCQYINVNTSWAFGVSSNTATYQQNNRSVDWNWSPDANTKYKITNDGRYIYIDGVQAGYITNTYNSYMTPGNGTIFKVNYTGSSSGFPYYASAKVYACKIYDGSTLVRNFIPCYRVSDGTIGLYDLVEGKFYTNAGTGTFKKGAPVNVWQMPSGYTELAYIRTTGTQFVDTLVFPGNNIQVETDIEVSATDNNLVVFGNYNNGSDNYGGGNYYHLASYQNAWYWGLNNSETHGGSYSTTVGTKYSLVFNNENSSVVVNNSVVGSCSGTVGYSGTTIALSRRGNNNSNNQWRGKYKYYNFKIYDKTTGKYIRDFVPCVRDSDGVIGMYDLITKQFFTNSGSGDFVAGPVVHRGIYKPAQYRTITYYPLEKDTKDLSDNQYDLTNNGHVTFESIDGLLAALFDATSTPGLINTDVTNLPQGGADMTISVWIRPTAGANSSEEDVRGLGASGTTSYTAAQLYKIFPFKVGTRGASLETSQNAVQNIWQNVIVTKSGTTWTITVNGVQIGSNTQTTSISGTNLSIGYSYRHLEGANYWYKGYMRDFIMESRAWSVEERLAYFESEKSKFGL